MKIIFDLDYTLLDTVKFKVALAAAVSLGGVMPKKFEAAYAEVVAKNGMFDPDELFRSLDGEFGAASSARAARDRFDHVLMSAEKYLYPGSRELLEALRAHEVVVDLLTFGNAKWQREKVCRSGLAGLFDGVIATEKEKSGIVRDIGRGETKVIVVNDSGREIQEMMAEAPEYVYILKKGPKAVTDDLRIPTAATIDALAALLEKETGWELRREMREAKEGESAGVEPGKRGRGGPGNGTIENQALKPPQDPP
jgi:phosphoglycolate phosphatase-like HAD superfamily hydrolase